MVSLLEQLPALIGVITGALGTVLATTLADRGRWRRERAVRWDERRFEAYVRFAQALKAIHHISSRMTAARRSESKAMAIDREPGLAQLAQAQANRSETWEQVLLLGDGHTIAAGREWRDAVFLLERLAREDGEVSQTWPAASVAADQARGRFYEQARASLSVKGAFTRGRAWSNDATNTSRERANLARASAG